MGPIVREKGRYLKEAIIRICETQNDIKIPTDLLSLVTFKKMLIDTFISNIMDNGIKHSFFPFLFGVDTKRNILLTDGHELNL
jgi:hypothetical protein